MFTYFRTSTFNRTYSKFSSSQPSRWHTNKARCLFTHDALVFDCECVGCCYPIRVHYVLNDQSAKRKWCSHAGGWCVSVEDQRTFACGQIKPRICRLMTIVQAHQSCWWLDLFSVTLLKRGEVWKSPSVLLGFWRHFDHIVGILTVERLYCCIHWTITLTFVGSFHHFRPIRSIGICTVKV